MKTETLHIGVGALTHLAELAASPAADQKRDEEENHEDQGEDFCDPC